jgi:hypothetical protein
MAKAKRKGAKGSKPARRSNSPSAQKSSAGRRGATGARASRQGATKSGRKNSGAKASGAKGAKRGPANSGRGPSKKASSKASSASGGKKRAVAKRATARKAASRTRREGGTGRERDLAQTPETGRSVTGPTNPMRTIRSTGTPAGAGDSHIPRLERERRQLRDIEESIPEPPSSLNMDRKASAARTGRAEMRQARREHTETSPALTGGDVDADWEDAYAVGDEAPGGDNPTPDQDIVDDIGRSLGVEYQDNEELKAADKVAERDKHRWELDPASSEDYRDRD